MGDKTGIKGLSEDDIRYVYENVRSWVAGLYGTSGWYHDDYFADENGYETFKREIEHDDEIENCADSEDVIEYIKKSLGEGIFMSIAQQSMLSVANS